VDKREKTKVQTVDPTTAFATFILSDSPPARSLDPSPLTGGGEQPDRSGQVACTPQRPHSLDMRLHHLHAYQQQLGPIHEQMQSPNMSQHHPWMAGGFPRGSPYSVQQQVPPDQFYGGGSPLHLRPPQMEACPRTTPRCSTSEEELHGRCRTNTRCMPCKIMLLCSPVLCNVVECLSYPGLSA